MNERQSLRIAEQLRKPAFRELRSLRFIYSLERIDEHLSYGRPDDPGGVGVFYTLADGHESAFEWMSP